MNWNFQLQGACQIHNKLFRELKLTGWKEDEFKNIDRKSFGR